MKATEIQKCMFCGKGMMHNGQIIFFQITIQRHAIDPVAVKERTGLDMMIGSQLAGVMGPNEDIANPFGDKLKGLVCMDCACEKNLCVWQMEEYLIDE